MTPDVRAFLSARVAQAQRWPRTAWTLCKVLWDAAFAFLTEEALIRAGSLAFTTLLSLVPLATVALRLMTFYGVSDATRTQLEHVFEQYLLPAQSRDVVRLVLDAADKVTQNIGFFGLASFCVTLVLLAREVEGHVLKICNKTSSWKRSVLHYLAFVLVAPTGVLVLLLLVQPFLPYLGAAPLHLGALNYPFVATFGVLATMLRAFSGYSLCWRSCAAGAAAAAVTTLGAWTGCLVYFAHSAALAAYGALACIPAFLLWVFVAWCCVLFGVQVAAKTQETFDCACLG